VIAFDYNAAALTSRIQAWQKAAGLTFPEALKKQAGLLKQDLWKGAPPSDRNRATKKAQKSVGARFYPKPKKVFSTQKQRGKNGMIWMYAHPKALPTVKQEDYRPELGLSDAISILNTENLRRKGLKWVDKGRINKGKSEQHAMFLNRIVISKGVIGKLLRYVRDRFGRQKAAWAKGYEQFGIKRPPQWVARHLATAKGNNQIHLTGDKPFIRIISQSRGVESARSISNVRRSIKKRAASMQADMKLYLAGIKKQAGFKLAPFWIMLHTNSVVGATPLVMPDFGIAENQSLTHGSAYRKEDDAEMVKGFNDASLHDAGNLAAFNHLLGCVHPFKPVAGNVGGVEGDELNLGGELAVLSRNASDFEVVAARPQFPVEPESLRQLAGEFLGRFDLYAAARPKVEAIPESPATVELLGEKPAIHVLRRLPVSQQRHVGFVHRQHETTTADCQLLETQSRIVIA